MYSFTGQKEEKKTRQAARFCHRYNHGYVYISAFFTKYILENSIYFSNVVHYQVNHKSKTISICDPPLQNLCQFFKIELVFSCK